MIALHCDQEDCDSWARTGSAAAKEFLTVTGCDDLHRKSEYLFCTLDCVGRWAIAHSEPTEQLVEL